MNDGVNIIIALVSFILVFSVDLVKYKYITLAAAFIMTVLIPTNQEWVYYYPLVAQIIAMAYGGYAFLTLLIFMFLPDWILVALTFAAIYITRLNHDLDNYEEENRTIRDQLTKDNLRLKNQHNELMKNHEKDVYMAGLNERNRIARDMHDALGHSLSSSILLIESLKYAEDKDDISNGLIQLQDRLKTGMEDIRTSIHHLYDTSIDFKSRLESYLNGMTNYHTDYQYGLESQLPHELKIDLLSIVREGLTNITKHSDADSVTVMLREHPSYITILIKDNGTGEHPVNSGMGLQTIQESVQKYSGIFNAFYDDGFTIHVILYKEDLNIEDSDYR